MGLAHARGYSAAIAEDKVMAPAKSMANLHQIVPNDRINAVLCSIFILVVGCILAYGVRACLVALTRPEWTAKEALVSQATGAE